MKPTPIISLFPFPTSVGLLTLFCTPLCSSAHPAPQHTTYTLTLPFSHCVQCFSNFSHFDYIKNCSQKKMFINCSVKMEPYRFHSYTWTFSKKIFISYKISDFSPNLSITYTIFNGSRSLNIFFQASLDWCWSNQQLLISLPFLEVESAVLLFLLSHM